jgi:hypothetical protein
VSIDGPGDLLCQILLHLAVSFGTESLGVGSILMPEEQRFPRESFTIPYPEQIVSPSGPGSTAAGCLGSICPASRQMGARNREIFS